ncbi:MAG: GNAT family N-acetyltransferase [Sphingobacterium sp.]|jgi:RimJ/RimL family protein N-acetyltransferase|nr:GNAT family N-acetyltransferase [Sphingobacterium sp.]
MDYIFKKAEQIELPEIWRILQEAIQKRKDEQSNQWQDGYPNIEVIQNDIYKEAAYVLKADEEIIGYCAIFINDEPEYANIQGKWLTDREFIAFHRVAIAQIHLGKGLAQKILVEIEKFAIKNNIRSIKADTNRDNHSMLRIFKKMRYNYCGEVVFRGQTKVAYEKIF